VNGGEQSTTGAADATGAVLGAAVAAGLRAVLVRGCGAGAALDAGALPGWSRDRPERAGVRIANRISESLVRRELPVRRRP